MATKKLQILDNLGLVSYNPQTLTDEQKSQARANIGAGEVQVQSDWNQNDESQLDYVKNRTHYEEENLIDIAGLEYSVEGAIGYASGIEYSIKSPFELGQKWNVWHDVSDSGNADLRYENLDVQEDADGNLYIGDLATSSIPFYVKNQTVCFSYSFLQAINPSIFKIVGVSGTYTGEPIVHQLDEKYIPTATDDEIIALLAQEDMLPVVADSDGSLLADENSNILLW